MRSYAHLLADSLDGEVPGVAELFVLDTSFLEHLELDFAFLEPFVDLVGLPNNNRN